MALVEDPHVDEIVPANICFFLHEHPLKVVPLSSTRSGVNIELSKSFWCPACKQLRYQTVRYCAQCQYICCTDCFDKRRGEQSSTVHSILLVEREQHAQQEAVRQQHLQNMKQLAERTAGLPPIAAATIVGDTATIKEIVEKNSFANTLDLEQVCDVGEYRGKTLLILAAQFGRREIATLFMSRGAKSETIDSRGMTPLMHASYNGHVGVLDELLFANVVVDRVASCGYTALLFAASRGHASAVHRLLAAGAKLTARTPLGRTSLIVAAFNGHVQVVELLLTRYSDMEVLYDDFEGYTARDAAIAMHHVNVERLISDRIAKMKR
jgi:ankyrin repeat protein